MIASNTKAIEALSSAVAADREQREREKSLLFQYLGRIAAAQSNFYEIQGDYYNQLADLTQRQAKIESQLVEILHKLSSSEN